VYRVTLREELGVLNHSQGTLLLGTLLGYVCTYIL
jgi:hypothetical protein